MNRTVEHFPFRFQFLDGGVVTCRREYQEDQQSDPSGCQLRAHRFRQDVPVTPLSLEIDQCVKSRVAETGDADCAPVLLQFERPSSVAEYFA